MGARGGALTALLGMPPAELEALCGELRLPAYAARQIASWLYARHAESIDAMTDLSLAARERLGERAEIGARAPERVTESADGTRKYLFAAAGGRFVEAAFIPEPSRATLCLSVQVGCARGCAFCMTGKQGLQGNLAPAEILNQYRSLPERERVTNIVFMGMGEPMDNLGNVLASLEAFTAPWGYSKAPRRITVSTVGVLPGLEEFLARSGCHLAVSMHTPFPEERVRLMPVERSHPLEEVLACLRRAAVPRRRRVSFEVIMFRDLNDSPRHAREIVRLLDGIRCRVNLIPFHPVPGAPFEPSPPERIAEFESILRGKGVTATIRKSRGLDIGAACGLLSTRALMPAAQAGRMPA